MQDLNKIREWVQAKKGRHAAIDLGSIFDNKYVRVWVWDYKLSVGQVVKSIEEIDLEAEKENRERAELERLKAKYVETA